MLYQPILPFESISEHIREPITSLAASPPLILNPITPSHLYCMPALRRCNAEAGSDTTLSGRALTPTFLS
jgi:hypothetical protein